MKKINYKLTGDILFQDKLENGLEVYYLPKPEYNKTYALFTTNFGSLDTKFIPRGQEDFELYPEGIAHFLEHKLFEKEAGDVFQDFGKLGAASNAFTSFNRTSYLFSTSDNVYENMEVLLDFVQEPYFTQESVEREQGIITQEIQMYQDDADWRLYFGLLQNLYPESPLADDIAGTPASIRKITAEQLYENYYTFYHPSNMTLFVTGPFDVEKMASFVSENQSKKEFPATEPVVRAPFIAAPVIRESQIQMDVVNPKFALGFRGQDVLPTDGKKLLEYRLSNYLLLTMLVGSTSKRYEQLYNSGLIDDSFDYSFEMHDRFHMASFTSDGENISELEEILTSALINFNSDEDFNSEHLELIKKDYLGNYYQSMNSLEFIANQFSSNIYPDITFFDYPEVLADINIKKIEKNVINFIGQMGKSIFVINPK